MKTQKLGRSDVIVSSIGLGMMGMSPGIYGAIDDEESIKTIHRALDLGVTLLDTADAYGNGHNEELLGKALKGRRDQAIVATKFSYGPNWEFIGGHPDYVKKAIDESLRRLGIDHIDLYYQHTVDPNVPIEETVGAMAELVKAGKVRYLGLSNGINASVINPATIRKAYEVHPISAIQSEYSIWTRDIEEEVVPTAKELGITLVAYSPLSRGFITGERHINENLQADDIRNSLARYQGDNFKENINIVDKLAEIAKEKNCTVPQLAIAWTIERGTLPIPGTKRRKYLEDNIKAVDIQLTPEDFARIDAVSSNVFGSRY
ncbi:aldo/keto reductase [Paenibacillus sp. AK121]|uniref:aldo/keto reductase n=1 Tax=Paenibacillus TaxID=44249 RepID=UPI0007EB6BC2|nr:MULTISPECIES: aldo/keto reductase [Paenibacillus]MBU9706058.1 aldo/keto reductase [Paenibacillus sp. AK121]OAZ48877.1 aldo/keto reductase [Paenibacillus polymyxa]